MSPSMEHIGESGRQRRSNLQTGPQRAGHPPALVRRNAEILHWESCATRWTPLPQEDRGAFLVEM
jgi:hypothetical protein